MVSLFLKNGQSNSAEEIAHTESVLRSLPKHYERIVLWFEHDSYDQICKSYVLAHLVEFDLDDVLVECIQVDYFPGVKKFIGIGQLSQVPESILVLWQQRQRVTPAQAAFGARCWQAFVLNNPNQFLQLAREANGPAAIDKTCGSRIPVDGQWLKPDGVIGVGYIESSWTDAACCDIQFIND